MKIVRERPCQRRHHRVTAPLMVTLPSGQELRATNWSLGGLRLDGVKEFAAETGEKVELLLCVPFQGYDISFSAVAATSYFDGDLNAMGLEFEHLDEKSHDLLKYFLDDLLRGKMATIGETICRIDVPVTPISTEPEPEASNEVPIRRMSLKRLFIGGAYIVLGLVLISYFGVLIYSNILRMEVRNAVTTVPLSTINMPVDGYLTQLAVEVDDVVRSGERIADVVSPEIENALQDLGIRRADALRNLERLDTRMGLQKERLRVLETVKQTRRDIVKAQISSQKVALRSADSNLERLLSSSFASEQDLAEAQAEVKIGALKLRELSLQLQQDSFSVEVSSSGSQYGEAHSSSLSELDLRRDEAISVLLGLDEQIVALERQKENLYLVAPFAGTVVAVASYGQTSLPKFSPVLTLAERVIPEVSAFLNYEQALNVSVDQKASVYLPALDRRVEARVRSIAPILQLNSSNTSFVSSEQENKGALVKLQLASANAGASEFGGGLSAIVFFPKSLLSNVAATFQVSSVDGSSR